MNAIRSTGAVPTAAVPACADLAAARTRRLAITLCLGAMVWGCQSRATTPRPGDAATPPGVAIPANPPSRTASPEALRSSSRDDGLTALPPGGVVYVTARPALVDHILAPLPAETRDEVASMIARALGTPVASSAALVRALSLDPTEPVLFAMVGPVADGIAPIVGAIADAKGPDAAFIATATEQAGELDPPLLLLMRVRATLARPDATSLLEAFAMPLRGTLVKCARATPSCAAFQERPLALVTGQRTIAAAYLTGRTLTVDIAQSYFLSAADPRVARQLDRFHRRTGGPPQGCATMDPKAVGSTCVLPDVAGQLGVATGLAELLRAISGAQLQPTVIRQIVELGSREAGGARRIARRQPRWLDDGTLSIRGQPGATEVIGSWSATAAADRPLRRAFPTERCAQSGGEFAEQLLPELARAFDAKPAGDAEARMQVDGLQEAGWAAWPVVWGRAWPSYLPVLMSRSFDWNAAGRGRWCVRFDDGRLEIENRIDLSALVTR